MELISFLNDQFWGESSYMVLFVISIVLILWGKRSSVKYIFSVATGRVSGIRRKKWLWKVYGA